MNPLRLFYLMVGWLSVGLGVIGIILPVLPTTPFLLVAVWAFSKSSPELAARLRNDPRVGHYIRDWQDHGVIPVAGKVMATVMMSVMGIYLAGFSVLPGWAALGACAVMIGVGAYVLSRPSKPPA